MARQPQTGLTQAHCDTLDCVLKSISETDQLIAQCDSCGLDVSAAKEENNRQRELASRLKATFFPMNH